MSRWKGELNVGEDGLIVDGSGVVQPVSGDLTVTLDEITSNNRPLHIGSKSGIADNTLTTVVTVPANGIKYLTKIHCSGMLNAKCLHETYHSPEAMQKTINEFVVLWNDILSKPFQWKYTGDGLHEKVVKRFNEMLNSTINIDRRLLIKQLKLHVNIINNYWDLIDQKVWLLLNEKILQQRYLVEYVIVTTKKKYIEDDLKCLKVFIDTLSKKLSCYIAKAA